MAITNFHYRKSISRKALPLEPRHMVPCDSSCLKPPPHPLKKRDMGTTILSKAVVKRVVHKMQQEYRALALC